VVAGGERVEERSVPVEKNRFDDALHFKTSLH
jgi:hypothetical protein